MKLHIYSKDLGLNILTKVCYFDFLNTELFSLNISVKGILS